MLYWNFFSLVHHYRMLIMGFSCIIAANSVSFYCCVKYFHFNLTLDTRAPDGCHLHLLPVHITIQVDDYEKQYCCILILPDLTEFLFYCALWWTNIKYSHIYAYINNAQRLPTVINLGQSDHNYTWSNHNRHWSSNS